MRRPGSWSLGLTAAVLAIPVLVGCGHSHPVRPMPGRTDQTASPLTTCVDADPRRPAALRTALARHFTADRVRDAFALDDGAFRAAPAPGGARPRVDAARALCNLLAGTTAENGAVLEAAADRGLGFGLGVVTVADAVLRTGPEDYLVGGTEHTARLSPYHARLAWLAVIEPMVGSSCPAGHAGRTAGSPPSAAPTPPAYQILAVDADTGAAGIVYSARSFGCGGSVRPPEVAPAAELVSAPWSLVDRTSDPTTATISYRARACDLPIQATVDGHRGPAVVTDPEHPAEVAVVVERVLTTCPDGPPVRALVHGQAGLPDRLDHAPVGARDVAAD